jgi:hypothetical protein
MRPISKECNYFITSLIWQLLALRCSANRRVCKSAGRLPGWREFVGWITHAPEMWLCGVSRTLIERPITLQPQCSEANNQQHAGAAPTLPRFLWIGARIPESDAMTRQLCRNACYRTPASFARMVFTSAPSGVPLGTPT